MTPPDLGSRLRPLHIHRSLDHYVIYEVHLGGLSYIGSFTETEFLAWLNGTFPAPEKPKPRKPIEVDFSL